MQLAYQLKIMEKVILGEREGLGSHANPATARGQNLTKP
jgi:hypothetical protein